MAAWRQEIFLVVAENISLVCTNVFNARSVNFVSPRGQLTGSFSNNDGDDNENAKKAISLSSKTTTLHVHHAFLYISLPSLHDYDVKMPDSNLYGGRKQAATSFSFAF